jgi:alpha-D-ribose 1-methylphosphonate 5-triphosphate synthase subunit PhnH
MEAALADIGPGLQQPVMQAQRVFRALLEAMARPGRLQRLPADVLQGLQPPALQPATAALLLTLLDADTVLHLGGRLQQPALLRYLGFHAGTRHGAAEAADFVVLAAAEAEAGLWARLREGTDLVPQAGATLVLEVPAMGEAADAPGLALRLRGPGIRDTQRLVVQGLDRAFWQARIAREAHFPRGIDLVLVAGACIAAVPRSTHVTLEG